MDDKDSILKKVETGIGDAAKAVGDLADEVAARKVSNAVRSSDRAIPQDDLPTLLFST